MTNKVSMSDIASRYPSEKAKQAIEKALKASIADQNAMSAKAHKTQNELDKTLWYKIDDIIFGCALKTKETNYSDASVEARKKFLALINTEVLKALDSIEVKKDTRQNAIKGADQGIQIGFNEAHDQFTKAIKQVKEKYTVNENYVPCVSFTPHILAGNLYIHGIGFDKVTNETIVLTRDNRSITVKELPTNE